MQTLSLSVCGDLFVKLNLCFGKHVFLFNVMIHQQIFHLFFPLLSNFDMFVRDLGQLALELFSLQIELFLGLYFLKDGLVALDLHGLESDFGTSQVLSQIFSLLIIFGASEFHLLCLQINLQHVPLPSLLAVCALTHCLLCCLLLHLSQVFELVLHALETIIHSLAAIVRPSQLGKQFLLLVFRGLFLVCHLNFQIKDYSRQLLNFGLMSAQLLLID